MIKRHSHITEGGVQASLPPCCWMRGEWRDTNNQYRLSVAFPELARAIAGSKQAKNLKEYFDNLLKGETK